MHISKSVLFSSLALLAIILGIPLAIVSYEAKRRGQPLGKYLKNTFSKSIEKNRPFEWSSVESSSAQTIQFLEKTAIGEPVGDTKPWITHLAITDLDKDGLKDVVICDAKLNYVCWIRQFPKGTYVESKIGSQIRGPAHVWPCDIDLDGDIDLLVAQMTMIFPSNDKIGGVVVLENNGEQEFTNHVLIDKIARVCDVRPGDLDGDGDIDLAVAEFGYDDGEIRWMENKGNWHFDSHILLSLSGAIHTPIVDIDKDGDLDIVALVSQEWEEIYVFENDGKANFKSHMIYGSTNEDFGSSGISIVDLDQDGDQDILYTNGDAFDYIPPGPRPWHGVQWLENKGNFKFEYHRLGDFAGAYFANAVDVDKDGDLDIVVVSAFNNWLNPQAQSMIWCENDGKMEFTPHNLASNPTHLLVLDSADMDDDGWIDFVTGAFYAYPPYDRMSRILLWRNIWPERKIDK